MTPAVRKVMYTGAILGGVYLLGRHLAGKARQAAAEAVEATAEASRTPFYLAKPEQYGYQDDATTWGTRAWFWGLLDGDPQPDPTASEAPDVVFSDDSDIPMVADFHDTTTLTAQNEGITQ